MWGIIVVRIKNARFHKVLKWMPTFFFFLFFCVQPATSQADRGIYQMFKWQNLKVKKKKLSSQALLYVKEKNNKTSFKMTNKAQMYPLIHIKDMFEVSPYTFTHFSSKMYDT